jgi:hypothetical protein
LILSSEDDGIEARATALCWELVWVWHSCVGGPPVLFAKVHQDRKDFISTVLSYRRRVQKDYTR